MTQPDLFAPHTLAHAHDPETSHDAASRARSLRDRHCRVILTALTAGPKTAHEIAASTDLDMVQVNRRLHEIGKSGKAWRTGEARATPSGRRAMVWAA